MKFSALVLVPVIALAACTPTTPNNEAMSSSSSSAAAMMQPSSAAASSIPAMMAPSSKSASSAMTVSSKAASSMMASSKAAVSSAASVQAQARVIVVAADNFTFIPNAITAKKGEKVTLRLKGSAGLHSFGSPELGLNVRVEEGKTVDIELPTDAAGTFSFRCMIPCGSGHKDMVGTIVIS